MPTETRTDEYIRKLKDNRIVAAIVIIAIVITAASTFITQIDSGIQATARNINSIFQKSSATNQPSCSDCDEIYTAALKDINEGKFTKPLESNFVTKLRHLNKKDPRLAQELTSRAVAELIKRIEQNITSQRAVAAAGNFEILKTIDPTNTHIALLALEISKIPPSQPQQIPTKKSNFTTPSREAVHQNASENQIFASNTGQDSKRPENLGQPIVIAQIINQNTEPKNQTTPSVSSTPPSEIELDLQDRIEAICFAMGSAYGDSSKLRILDSSLKSTHEITTKQASKLFTCSGIYGDSSLTDSLRTIFKRQIRGRLTSSEVKNIIDRINSDSSKSSAIDILSPFM